MTKRPEKTLSGLIARVQATRDAAADQPAKAEREWRHAKRGEELWHGIGGNGGPALDAPPPRRLRLGAREVLRLGVLLYGDRHTTDLARLTGEDPGQVRRWRRGEGAPPGRLAAWSVRREAEERIAELRAAVAALDALHPPAHEPAPAPVPPAGDPRQIDLIAYIDAQQAEETR
ncbi:hypothetical protein [Methylorubrum extorquens]|uniref:Transposase n=1 Tax=Methylorubrum extorquens TaxID=408 RepID=A0AAX3WB51_METEX|nr:hypothetical protein [Methylorubrum extorquens]WHQ68649.1 hypothetical protein KEC54_20100 [Methylorubrum extorquens]